MMRLSFSPVWKRKRYLVPLAVTALMNVVIYGALTFRLATKQERQARQYAEMTQEIAEKRRGLAELETRRERITRNDAVAVQFWSEVIRPRRTGLTGAWEEIDRLARESGVVRGRTSYDYEELDVGLAQVVASMPVTGSYFNLVRFINRLERASHFFVVREIRLTRGTRTGGDLELTCGVVFYLKPGESGDVESS